MSFSSNIFVAFSTAQGITTTRHPGFVLSRVPSASPMTSQQKAVREAAEYLKLKKQVDLTNIQTQVTIGKVTYSISDLLQIKRSVGKLMEATYTSLNDMLAERRLMTLRSQAIGEKGPRVERMYDETDKHEGLQSWQSLRDEIETRIEVVNATTELVEV